MEETSSRKATTLAATQEIPRVLTEPDSSSSHNSQPPVAILSQINPLHALLSLFKMYFNNFLPIAVQVFYMGSSLQVPNQKSYTHFLLPHTCHRPHPSPLFDRPKGNELGLKQLIVAIQSTVRRCHFTTLHQLLTCFQINFFASIIRVAIRWPRSWPQQPHTPNCRYFFSYCVVTT
jgi:hypothetical protein